MDRLVGFDILRRKSAVIIQLFLYSVLVVQTVENKCIPCLEWHVKFYVPTNNLRGKRTVRPKYTYFTDSHVSPFFLDAGKLIFHRHIFPPICRLGDVPLFSCDLLSRSLRR